MQKVYLNGAISKFGDFFEVECTKTIDVFKLFSCQLDGFRQYMIDAAEAGISFEIIKGDKILAEGEHLLLSLTEEDIVITEVPSGSKGGLKIIAAIVIVAFMWWNPFAWGGAGSMLAAGHFGAGTFGALAVNMGVGLALNLAISGITELLMSPPEVDGSGVDSNDAYLFNGPTNSIKYGQAIPVAYGELLVGGAPVSAYYTNKPL